MSQELTEVNAFLAKHPQVTTVELLVVDLDGIVRGKRVERSLLEKVYDKGFCLPQSVLGLDATGETVFETKLGMATGDADRICKPIPGTLCLVPWHEGADRAQALCSMYEVNGDPLTIYPRNVLQRAVNRFDRLGFKPGIALELEFYLIDQERTADGALQPPVSPVSGQRMSSTQVYSMLDLDDYDFFIRDVIEAARSQGVPADAVIAEYAPGQFEVNLDYSNDIMKATDDAVLLKRVITNIARKHGMHATFMAKPYAKESGSGLHMHMSLTDADGDNAFESTNPTDNELLRHAVAGLLDMAKSTQAFCCPTVNSYRRLAPGSFAPTKLTWGYDNRTVAMRIPSGSRKAARIENRMPGADANPYFAVTALLAGIVEGLENKMTAPEPSTGNAYDTNAPDVPDNQRDSLRAMESDTRVQEWFGEQLVDVYKAVKWSNVYLFESQVTALEYELLLPVV
jgi:glutamine synthetase